VARIGGDEFAVFAGGAIAEEGVRKRLERFILPAHEYFDKNYSEYGLSTSIGFFSWKAMHMRSLCQKTDKALYKARGREKTVTLSGKRRIEGMDGCKEKN